MSPASLPSARPPRPRALARTIHRRFKDRPGSRHIATETAIAGFVAALRRRRPRRVLELGAGIGTLTAAAIETLRGIHGPDGWELVTIEDHPFCIAQLTCNLAREVGSFEQVTDLADLSADARYDFLVVDGGDPADPRPFRLLAPRATVFIEGDRRPQAALLEAELARAGRPFVHADMRTLRRRPRPSPWTAPGGRVYDGGYRLYQLEPTGVERLRHRWWHLRTGLVYRLRPWL